VSRDVETYDLLARVLDYPGPEYRADVERCRNRLAEPHVEAAAHLASFVQETLDNSLEQMEELFTRTFDLSPKCSLETGWHLFGENYDRGAFLVWMREQLRKFELNESAELPDHLTHVLAVLARMEPEEGDRFATEAVLVATELMLSGLKDKNNPYEHVLRAVQCVLTANHGAARQRGTRLPLLAPHEAIPTLASGV
jgi:nitrate reductase delta subunit